MAEDDGILLREVDLQPEAQVVGSTQLFKGGVMQFVPMPTPDPKDPLNLPTWRKWAAIAALCFFGALALAAEATIGSLVPIFVLEYAGRNPKSLSSITHGSHKPGQINLNPLSVLDGIGGEPISKVSLIASLPIIVNGVASFILVPLSIAVGTSLNSHLAARVCQGFGAGAVEALIALIIQDVMFIHQRNKAISLVGASQGLIVVSLGVSAPVIVARLSWRYLYWITASAGVVAWLGLIAFVPETRWIRSSEELAGKSMHLIQPGETRPQLNYARYGYRTNWTEFGVLKVTPNQWRLARISVVETIKAAFFPNVFWMVLLNSILVGAVSAASQTGSAVLIAAGWKFENLGLAAMPVVVATPFIWFFGGFLADKISNFHAKRNGGQREPEAHLINLVIPLLAGITGPLLFGFAASNIRTLPSIVVLVGIFLMGFGALTTSAVISVYLVESYPNYAGPVLVSVSSFRLIFGFLLSFKITNLIMARGFLNMFGIYSGALAAVALLLPVIYIYGKPIRAWSAGRLEATSVAKEVYDEEEDDGDRGFEPHDRKRRGRSRETVRIGKAF
ncbi:major facilitator superfamily domain-containing protein [Pseudomassariella vexata]|uniref:Major facilitator superfamily domain-containing protein n=1 Tax=Pseudomassariella vexata TaxID=1141098 RepID=A0A1Y2E6X7_9PEZI|nr:major facilitator superfamily domain-containing protein [Pseudomassariella vexata]ORY67310.1 major facilitator superfamily domain-containing protein [Pseudomassariella vexata]